MKAQFQEVILRPFLAADTLTYAELALKLGANPRLKIYQACRDDARTPAILIACRVVHDDQNGVCFMPVPIERLSRHTDWQGLSFRPTEYGFDVLYKLAKETANRKAQMQTMCIAIVGTIAACIGSLVAVINLLR